MAKKEDYSRDRKNWGLRIYLAISALFLFIALLAVYTFYDTYQKTALPVIKNDDPLLIEAKSSAKNSLPEFLNLYEEYPKSSFVRYNVKDNDLDKRLWAKVSRVEDEFLIIDLEGAKKYLSLEQIDDWMVNISDTFIRGGFTTQVILIRMSEKNSGKKEKYLEELSWFKDKLNLPPENLNTGD